MSRAERVAEARRLYRGGRSHGEIADWMGVQKSTVVGWLKGEPVVRSCADCGVDMEVPAISRAQRCGECLTAREKERHRKARRAQGVSPRVAYGELGDRSWLERQYSAEGRFASEIASEIGCSTRAVLDALRRHRIQIRRRGTRSRRISAGTRFGRLEVIAEIAEVGSRYLCRCDCGGESVVLGSELRRGKVRSCGCLAREILAQGNSLAARARRAEGAKNAAAVRKAAQELGRFTLQELAERVGLSEVQTRKHLMRLMRTGAISAPRYEFAFQKPTGVSAPPSDRAERKAGWRQSGGASGRSQLPPDKELRKVALRYGGDCRARADGHYELTLANGQRVTLSSTPKNPSGAAKAAIAEIERKLAA